MHIPGNYDYVGLVPDPKDYAVLSLATDLGFEGTVSSLG